ncbi:hypothetical protein ACRN9T_03335 [Shewanella baltica]|uniref:hypothetical protein n=1 Tax=Shewanella baltica TaxID=62322 RepID=UPI003D799D4A
MRLIAISLLLGCLSGCATSAVSVDQAKSAPVSRVFINDAANTEAEITLIRDSGMMGGGCYVDVYLNDKLAATLDTSEKVTIKVNAGELYLGSQLSGSGLCIGSSIRHLETSIKQGQHKLYRVMTGQSGDVQIVSGGITSN